MQRNCAAPLSILTECIYFCTGQAVCGVPSVYYHADPPLSLSFGKANELFLVRGCPRTCPDSRLDQPFDIEQLTVCDYLALNGMCHNGALQASLQVQLLNLDVGVFSFWTADVMQMQCALSCQSAFATSAPWPLPPSYNQDPDHFCTAIVPQVLPSNGSNLTEFGCGLYGLSACCKPLVESNGCSGLWKERIDARKYATFADAAETTYKCGVQPQTLSLWVLAATLGGMLVVFLASYACCWARWLWMRCRISGLRIPAGSHATYIVKGGSSVRDEVLNVADVLEDPPTQLLGVNVSRLAAALHQADAATVEGLMTDLWKGQRFLCACNLSMCK